MSGFESFLVVLDELQEETCDEHDLEEHAEQESFSSPRVGVPVHRPGDAERHKAVEDLVYLRRVTRHCLAVAHEDKAPWQVGRTAVYLTVHQVAETDEHGGKAHAYAEPVENPYPRGAKLRVLAELILIEEHRCDDESYRAAVARQATFPDLEQSQRVLDVRIAICEFPCQEMPRLAVLVPLVEPTMT